MKSIRELGCDVLAVQEIRGSDDEVVGRRLRQLADDVGMRCLVTPAGGDADAACPRWPWARADSTAG